MYQAFRRRILLNYIVSSLIAVFGVGSIFIFHTLILNMQEILLLLGIMTVSVVIMLTAELLVFRKDVKPIHRVLHSSEASEKDYEKAFISAHRFPMLSARRILGPHLFGLGIPASFMTIFFIGQETLSLEYYYVAYAWFGAVLIAVMHALIEFFLTYKPSNRLAEVFMKEAETKYGRELQLDKKYYITYKTKLFVSILFIALFPVFLFILALQIRAVDALPADAHEFWSWASLILLIISGIAAGGAYLLYINIQEPIEEIQEGFIEAGKGNFMKMEKTYGDEFNELINGFNHMIASIEKRDKQNNALLDSVFSIFAATLDARDEYTAGHAVRVADYAVKIAEELNFNSKKIDFIRKSALLHDIGKIGIRDEILLKQEHLSKAEFETMKEHPVIGERMLLEANLPEELLPLLPGVRHHHERFDGKGYPDGLKGAEIPELGRLLCVADSFDAMTSDRPYVKGKSFEKALKIIYEEKGTQFDPVFAEAFIQVMNKNELKQAE
ncbi:HD-GYP domain-containing protein [Alkalicoccus daliensis]|uniref:HDIG domain-containing protein n=1 Tax=Alkalicoccus daliensis TaxID=745820 RepID=A0A1G9ZJS1_9BACI|nr:HD-GYP domain-containing protein [Alkalicoccus daliensis]SDN20763.1 HDIG domain-containing protein [Alkalicoccus daliensis]